jgi:AI-2E family transporter
LGVYFIGIPHPLLWGVLASLLRFVPYIGTPVAAAFPMGLALAVFPGWSQLAFTFALFLLLELTIANLVEPWLYGSHTGVSSLAILVAAIFWGTLWGPVGLLLSTPLTVCLILMGRYVPQLSFLEIVLGDEPVLSPQAHFYQRLLALDDEEARDIAENYLKEKLIGEFYDSVLIPALNLAETDRHMNVIDEIKTKFIYQSTRELIEELYEDSASLEPDHPLGRSGAGHAQPGSMVVCIPARDEADEIVGIMAMQLLRRAGQNVNTLPIGSVSTMVEKAEQLHPDVICISALPPFASVQARSLCKQVRRRCRDTKIFLGLWGYPGGVPKAQERVGSGCADMIGTSLSQMVLLIGQGNC